MGNSRTLLNLALRVFGTASVGASRGFPTRSSSYFCAVSDLVQGSWCIRGQTGLSRDQRGSITPGAAAFWSSAVFCGTSSPGHWNAGLLGAMGGRAAAAGPLMETMRNFATKLKHPKVKAYSSYKLRFRGMANGLFKRSRAGKQHNAHSKSNKQQRQLRRASVCPPGLAKAMKSLNFQL